MLSELQIPSNCASLCCKLQEDNFICNLLTVYLGLSNRLPISPSLPPSFHLSTINTLSPQIILQTCYCSTYSIPLVKI